MVEGFGQNVPVPHLSPDISLRTCDTVAHHPNPSASHRSFKMFKISAPEGHNTSYRQSPSLVSPTTVPLYGCLCVRPSVSVTFLTVHMVTESVICDL